MAMSKQNILLLIVIVLMQVCLLDARRLEIVRKSTVSNLNRNVDTATTDSASSCAPHQHQLKYYNKLYSSSAANNFNGNIMYYALRAVEAHNNRTESTVTAEDNATIANITDHSRFAPAGMELANKVICAKILQEIDTEVSLISKTALCAWDYACNYRADRFPNYLFKARCKTATCNSNCDPNSNRHNMCQSHGIHVTILEMRDNCEEWVWGQELLPLACTCTNDVMMKAESMSG